MVIMVIRDNVVDLIHVLLMTMVMSIVQMELFATLGTGHLGTVEMFSLHQRIIVSVDFYHHIFT